MGLAPNCEKRGTYWISAIQYLSVSRPRFQWRTMARRSWDLSVPISLGKRVFLRRSQERTGRLLTAFTIKGKRDQKSFAATCNQAHTYSIAAG